MEIAALTQSSQALNVQRQSLDIDTERLAKAELFAGEMAAARAQSVAPAAEVPSTGLIDKVVDSLREMQVDFRNVMSGLMSDSSRTAAFGSSAPVVASGNAAQANFEMSGGASNGVNGYAPPAALDDKSQLMYSMTRELIGSQLNVTRVVVAEQMFSTTAGKVQKSSDMLLRGQ
ncbi:MAG: hypothetical protein HWE20_15150 [Gammaproteobacteria bacterium]|nr:hypothetical protein [Gammaproteobacteria bacterium]